MEEVVYRKIYRSFDGKLVGNKIMKQFVCSALAMMPKHIQLFVTKKCWFVASMDDAFAFAFTGNDLKGQHLVFLSDDLWIQNEKQIYYTIAHEIGHVFLGHRNSTLVIQNKREIRKQEKEADEFAKTYCK